MSFLSFLIVSSVVVVFASVVGIGLLRQRVAPSLPTPVALAVGAMVGLSVTMFLPISYCTEIVKTQTEPVIQTNEVAEIGTLGTHLVTPGGDAHLSNDAILFGIVLAVTGGLATWIIATVATKLVSLLRR